MEVRPIPSRGQLFWRGVTRACAACGQRGLTRRVVHLAPECPRCGFRFERHPGHFVGAVGMSTVVTFGLILVTLLGGIAVFWPDVTFAKLVAAPLAVALLVPIAIHPNAKTLWAAIDLMMNPLGPGEALRASEERPAEQRRAR